MATEYHRDPQQARRYDANNGFGYFIGALVIAFVVALALFFTVGDRTLPGTSVTSTPRTETPQPRTATPPASQTTPSKPAPSTK